MNIKSIEKALIQLQASPLAIKAYLLLCKTPNLNITQISIELGTYRQKIYIALDELAEIGLIEKNKEKIILKSPVVLKTLLKNKQYELNRATVDYEDTLPELLSHFFQEGKNPSIKVYDGTNKFRYLFNIILDELGSGGQILSYNEGDDLYQSMDMDYYFDIWIPKRIKKNIFIKILANSANSKYHQEKSRDKVMYRDSKILNNNAADKGCYWIAGNKIILWDTIAPKAILIENAILSKLLAGQFEMVWNQINY